MSQNCFTNLIFYLKAVCWVMVPRYEPKLLYKFKVARFEPGNFAKVVFLKCLHARCSRWVLAATEIEEPNICSAVVAHNFGQDQIPLNKNKNLHDCSWEKTPYSAISCFFYSHCCYAWRSFLLMCVWGKFFVVQPKTLSDIRSSRNLCSIQTTKGLNKVLTCSCVYSVGFKMQEFASSWHITKFTSKWIF